MCPQASAHWWRPEFIRKGFDFVSTESLSAPKILDDLIHQAEKAGASDIHLHMADQAALVSFRLDGLMTPVSTVPMEIADRVFGRIKFLAKMKTYQESMPQDGRIEKSEVGSSHDIRVATYPTVTGEKIVLRLFTDAAAKSLRELDFPPDICTQLERFLGQSSGLLLLTGPSGSGKTTTIYACLRHLAGLGGRQIITVEDPVERIIPGVMQTEVSEARGLTFSKAARHLLRQDPQVLVIGEIRDDETAGIVVRAALTGHMVISTIHAGSCRGVLERLMVMCPDHHAVTSVIGLVLNQRLVRRVCPGCGGKGCGVCLNTGFAGRAPVTEWLHVDESLRAQIRDHGIQSLQPGKSLEESARALRERGVTSETECQRVIGI